MARRNYFKAAFEGIIDARQRQAERYVAGYLRSLDDETLRRIGRTRPTRTFE